MQAISLNALRLNLDQSPNGIPTKIDLVVVLSKLNHHASRKVIKGPIMVHQVVPAFEAPGCFQQVLIALGYLQKVEPELGGLVGALKGLDHSVAYFKLR